ncbi:alpha/beta hydrolase fold domain-containing protein [Wenyingzhuangia fucanilytica]|nr:alpha/beta hydrolase fold domain-containing protein [Wenyingzhuangia fucanilytica]
MSLIMISFLFIGTAIAQEQSAKVNPLIEFSKLDANNNGFLERNEVVQTWKQLRAFDSDKNNKLSKQEFLNYKIPYLKTKGDVVLNIKYKTTKEEDLYLDIYYPEAKPTNQKLPVVVYTHGGGWFNGSKENIVKSPVKEPFLELINKGFAVVSVNYRLTRLKSVLMRDCVIDAMDAVRYLSKNSEDLGLDTNNLFVLGDSAGGHIAQMITLANPNDFKGDKKLYGAPYKVIAGVSWYGPSDFTIKELFKTDDKTKEADRFSSRITKTESNVAKIKEMYQEMSPIFYLTSNSPPLFIMAADNDTTIPVAHAYHIKEKADDIGATVSMFIVKNAGHNWRKAGGDIDPTLGTIVQKTVDFFEAYKN